MTKQSMLTILLISAICLLVDSVAGWVLFDLGALAAVVLSILFFANARKVFGDEAESARQSCLWSFIANGSMWLIANTVGILIGILTIGIGWALGKGVEALINIGFGIWQIVVWSKLKTAAAA